jgi:periplasmic divalent cation tolerance protein
METRVLLCTCPPGDADRIAETLLERRLVACVNAVPGVVSRYRWKGKLEKTAETLLVLKTEVAHVPAIVEALPEIHPYDVAELLTVPVESGNPAYLDWVSGELRPD